MSLVTEQQPTQAATFCVNHPTTETYLRCNKCGRPVCIKCVQRTPVGYRCKECLGEQRAGYYTATPIDYAIATFVALFLGGVSAFLISLLPIGFLAIFAGPFAGGVISESIRRLISKRRGRYLALVATACLVIGGVLVLLAPILPFVFSGRPELIVRALANIWFWIFIVLAAGTTYARLRV